MNWANIVYNNECDRQKNIKALKVYINDNNILVITPGILEKFHLSDLTKEKLYKLLGGDNNKYTIL